MVRLRLRRMGTKARPFYRIVAAPKSAARNGRFVEQLGHYDPLQEPSLVKLDRERVLHWLNHGASVSDTLERLLKREGVWEEFESSKPASKPKRKAVKERVKKEKPVKVKKQKPKPVEAEAAPEEAVAEETPIEEPVAEEAPAEEAPAEEAPAEEDKPAEDSSGEQK